MEISTALLIAGTSAFLTGGVAWGTVKQALNGTRERVKNIEQNQYDHEKLDEQRFGSAADRLARIETKIDILLEKR
jgi:hypothetical protein